MSKYEKTVFGPIKYSSENSLLEGKPILSLIFNDYDENIKENKFNKKYILKCVENHGGFKNGWCNFKDCWIFDPKCIDTGYIGGIKSIVYYKKAGRSVSSNSDLVNQENKEIEYINNMQENDFNIFNNNNIDNYYS
jgi:hypothetical protein